jgi:ribosome production factor 2
MKPSVLFQGNWDSQPFLEVQNVFLDFFQGEKIESVNLAGLEACISITHHDGIIFLRVYTVYLKKSGDKLPRVELVEMGPRLDLQMRRTTLPPVDLWKRALRVPGEKWRTKVKNVAHDNLGDKLGQIHMEKQDLSKLQTRKMKGLRGKELDESEMEVDLKL